MAMLPVEKFSFANLQKMPALRTANSADRYPGCAEDVDLELESSSESLQNIGKFRNKVMHSDQSLFVLQKPETAEL